MLPSDWLIKNGWCPQMHRGQSGCLVVAITRCDLEIPDFILWYAAEDLLGLRRNTLVTWNDYVCPNQETAVAVMRQAEINCGLRTVSEELVEEYATI